MSDENAVQETTEVANDKLLSMSDDDISNMTHPPEEAPASSGSTEEVTEAKVDEKPEVKAGEKDKAEPEEENPLADADNAVKDEKKEKKEEKKDETKPEGKAEDNPEGGEAENKDPDYRGFYEKLMSPMKASGRNIQLKTVDEALKLIHLGADYTKRMQQLKPNLKLMRMLQNNNLLSEEKLTFLIDLDKKDPAAVNKFMKDRNIDPLDLDPESDVEYKPGKHAVSDEEVAFTSTLEEVKSTRQGLETIAHIERDWDQTSIKMLYREPEIMKLIDEQRADGIFTQITSELDRRKMLGQIPDSVPFLTAYQSIGAELHQAGILLSNGKPTLQRQPAVPQGQQPVQPQQPAQPEQRTVLESRPAGSTATGLRNNAAARAAAPVRTSPGKPAPVDFNPLSMSDDEFEKQSGAFKI